MYGGGIYFADRAGKALQYARPEERERLTERLLLGASSSLQVSLQDSQHFCYVILARVPMGVSVHVKRDDALAPATRFTCIHSPTCPFRPAGPGNRACFHLVKESQMLCTNILREVPGTSHRYHTLVADHPPLPAGAPQPLNSREVISNTNTGLGVLPKPVALLAFRYRDTNNNVIDWRRMAEI